MLAGCRPDEPPPVVSEEQAVSEEPAVPADSFIGGTIYLGVADDGTTPGLSADDVRRLNQLIGNTANHAVRSPLTVQTKNVALSNGRVVIVLTVPKGLDKPYFDKNGVIWLKAGADKRRVNSKEELRRLFQRSPTSSTPTSCRRMRASTPSTTFASATSFATPTARSFRRVRPTACACSRT
jgi:hypothetical protein